MKILIVLALVLVLYYMLRGLFRSHSGENRPSGAHADAGWPKGKELVKDPYCQTYVPRNTAVRSRIKGEDFFFCSEDCMNRYISEKKRGSSQAA